MTAREERAKWPIVKGRIGEQDEFPDYSHLTPDECMELVCELSAQAWAMSGGAPPTGRRDVLRIIRRPQTEPNENDEAEGTRDDA